MNCTPRKLLQRLKSPELLMILVLLLSPLAGCGSDDDHSGGTQATGYFIDSAVSGLDYQSGSLTGTTGADGAFTYIVGSAVAFSIGDLALGSATGAETLTPLSLVSDAADATDQRVNNMLVFLQLLDVDGDLNNGIQITSAIADIVSEHAAEINFDQGTVYSAFPSSLSDLLADLNTAGVFTDTHRGDRAFPNYFFDPTKIATMARAHFENTLKERVTTTTSYGPVRGFAPDENTWQWRGIPYAAPPVGDLRWTPPQAPTAWTEAREAVAYGDQAAQNPTYALFGEGGVSEDCLYLNVTAPRDAEGLPVMVWFHGGEFSVLTANTSNYNNPLALPTKDVVVVTVNHRLGIFGYFAHPLLTAESDQNISGNYGQLDLIAALEWVQANIENFGGNPENVTIFGESGGGGKVLSLLASPLAAGLFHKAACQSGTADTTDIVIRPFDTLAAAEAEGARIIGLLNAEDTIEVATLDEMRDLPWRTIASTLTQYDGTEDDARFCPTVDTSEANPSGHYLPDTMETIYAAGDQNDVPLIIGANEGDYPTLTAGLLYYLPWMYENSSFNIYAYVFTHVPTGWRNEGVTAYHGLELVYLFNSYSSLTIHWLIGLPQTGGATQQDPGLDELDPIVIENMMTLWSNFAKTGDPSVDGGVQWLPYGGDSTPQYLEIDDEPAMQPDINVPFSG
jgi:para-nitrobenzyl esterase